mmetsp:Transcript_17449/g.19430  ORF Transcript_17449/g.19430 Transcript_17449/m.19430 type:complete len:145 (+) Transcript_17449:133-567(+)
MDIVQQDSGVGGLDMDDVDGPQVDFTAQLAFEEAADLPKGENTISYATVAKRVDVKALKSDIWKSFTKLSIQDKDTDESDEDEENENPVDFKNVLAGFSDKMQKKHKDASVQYCFICLLHLANEKCLSITQTSDDTLSLAQDVS